MNKALCLTILLFLTTPAFSSGIRLAVLDLSPSNVPAHYAAAVRDRIEVSLYKSNKIELLERNKVQLVLKEHNLISSACRDASCAVQIGKFLSATHVIVGNVTYLDRYTITVRVVDVLRGKIVYADTESAPSKDRITDASARLAARVLEHIDSIPSGEGSSPGKPRFSLTAGAGYAQPLGAFTHIARGGYSVTLSGSVHNLFVNNLFFGIKGSFNRFPGKRDVRYSMIIPFMAGFGYRIELPKSFFISPSLSGGGAWNYVRNSRSGGNGIVEPIVNSSLSLGYNIITALSIYILTGYSAIFERNAVIQFMTFNICLSFSFI